MHALAEGGAQLVGATVGMEGVVEEQLVAGALAIAVERREVLAEVSAAEGVLRRVAPHKSVPQASLDDG